MITKEEVLEVLDYDPLSGIFTWIAGSAKLLGYEAGTLLKCQSNCTYIRIGINDSRYLAHRLAWLVTYGYLPEFIDHIDNVGTNNAISNLRETTHHGNMFNRAMPINNTVGVKGITYREDSITPRYVARVGLHGERISKSFNIEMYGSKENALEEATLWVDTTRKQLHGDFARHE